MARPKTLTEDDRKEKSRQKHAAEKVRTENAVYEQYGGHCVFCGERVSKEAMKLSLIVPYSEGGKYVKSNMELSCRECYHRERRKRAKELAKERPKRDKKSCDYRNKQQLCWSCKKACGGYDCEWANKLKPVEGWTATLTVSTATYSYHITDCPKYEK